MIRSITAHRVANDIRMIRSQYAGTFLLVEGVKDIRFYERFIDQERCRLIIAHNKENAVGTLSILDREKFSGVLAIVDADFWVLEGISGDSPNLFLTDSHDLETMILDSPALEKFLTEYGSKNKIKTFTNQYGKDVREILLEGGISIGYLRWLSLQDSLALKFEDLPFNKFVDDKTLTVNEVQLIRVVKNHSQKHQLNERHIQGRMARLRNDSHNPWHVCCGHDLICILSIGLRRAIGSYNAGEVEPEKIERALRLAYEQVYFLMTQLYKSIKAWEEVNNSFKVLFTVG
jgi:hypothetical protein